MNKSTNEVKANSVNGVPTACSSRNVALGRSLSDQEETVRYQLADPGLGGDQASPAQNATGTDHNLDTDTDTSMNISNLGETSSPPNPHGAFKPNAPTQKTSKTTKGRNSVRPKNTSSRPSLEEVFGTRKFDRYFSIRPNGESNLTRLNMFKVDRAIRNKIGICEKISEDFQNRSWTVEVRSEEQGRRLMDMTTLLQESVTVAPHEIFNQSRGVITCSMLKGYSDDDITEGLAEHGVIQCRRIIKNPKSPTPDPTSTLILTFNTSNPPDSIIIRTGLKERVRPYIPLPRRCYKSQLYGHSGAKCRRDLPVCARCGGDAGENHKAETCQLPIKCIHCNQPHYVSSKNCPKYLYEKEIITIKTKEHLTFAEARAKVNATHNPRSRTYANITNPETLRILQPSSSSSSPPPAISPSPRHCHQESMLIATTIMQNIKKLRRMNRRRQTLKED